MVEEKCPTCGKKIDSRGLTSHKNSKNCRARAKANQLKEKNYKRTPTRIKRLAKKLGYSLKRKKTGINKHSNDTYKEWWIKEMGYKKITDYIDENLALVQEDLWVKELKENGVDYSKADGKGGIYVETKHYEKLVNEAERLPRYTQRPTHEKVFETSTYLVINIKKFNRNATLVFKKDEKYRGSKMRKRKFIVKKAKEISHEKHDELGFIDKSLFNLNGNRVATLVSRKKADEFIGTHEPELVANLL